MARGDKPYRVYRGGRARGSVPTTPRPGRPQGMNGRPETPALPRRRRRRRRFGWGRRIGLVLFLLLALLVAWGVASFLTLRGGVDEANDRLDEDRGARAALTPQDGLLTSIPTTILLLGTDHAETVDRVGSRRADSIMLVRTDPKRHRLHYLTIPRDLRVEIPGHGANKVNAAFQLGGAELAIQTVRAFTGLEINHVALVDFGSFRGLIDAMGSIDVDVPAPILANKFDCPYATQAECDRWAGWRFERGQQSMDGRRALIYARVRKNSLNPSESDLTRAARQQQVVQSMTDKLLRPTTLARLPAIAGDVVRPLATDLTAAQVVQLGWLRFRADSSRTLRCRLGGTAAYADGQAVLLGSEENVNTIAMFTGATAPQPPAPASGPFGPGCFTGASPAQR